MKNKVTLASLELTDTFMFSKEASLSPVYKVLFESVAEGLVVTNEAGAIVLVNARTNEMFEYGDKELIGQKLETLLPKKYHEKHVKHRIDYNKAPKQRSMGIGMDLWAKRKDDTEFPVMVSLNYFKSEGKTFAMALVTDITNKKKAEEDMQRALEKEKQLNELKSQFISMASHEFRTPLSTILSSSSLVEKYLNKDDIDAEDVKENTSRHLKRIKSSVGNLTGILNDFLSLDKLEQGKVEIKPSHFHINKFAEELIEEIQAVLKKGQKILYVHSGKTEICVDEQMLKNIIYNLISNASIYSPEDSVIEFSSTFDTAGLTITVTDHGIGIPDKDKVHLFERFFRAKNVTNIQGTGLGLNIVKRYSELINGKISFNSKEGEGTTFKLNLANAYILTEAN